MGELKYEEDVAEFLKEDTTQAFVSIFIVFTVLLISGYLDMSYYTELMKWGIIGLFGKELTNFRGLK